MSRTFSKKMRLGVMVVCLLAGTVIVLLNRKNAKPLPFEVNVATDTLMHTSFYEKRSSLYLDWMKLNRMQQAMQSYYKKDSLTQQEKAAIKNIDQQLNHLLHERN